VREFELHCVSRLGRRIGDNLYSLPSGRKLFKFRHVKKLINQDDESVLSNSKATGALLSAVAEADHSGIEHTIWCMMAASGTAAEVSTTGCRR
jgi:hypothetical protein